MDEKFVTFCGVIGFLGVMAILVFALLIAPIGFFCAPLLVQYEDEIIIRVKGAWAIDKVEAGHYKLEKVDRTFEEVE